MARLAREDLIAGLGLAALVAFPLLAGALGASWLLELVTRMLIYGLAALSLNLILGYGGMVSFGHAAFFGAGAYVVAILAYHDMMGDAFMTWPFQFAGSNTALVAWPAAMLAAGLLAAVIGALSLKTGGLYFIMITLAFAQMIYYFFISLPDYGGEDGISLFARSDLGPLDLNDDRVFYYLCLTIVVLFVLAKRKLVAARFGWTLRGIRDNERRMRAVGYSPFRHKLSAFALAGAVAGLAGALMANLTEFVSPSFLAWHLSGEFLIIVILGGMGRLYGPIAGAIVFLLLEFALKETSEHWQLFLGPILVLVVLFARNGLWGLIAGREKGHG